MARCESTFLLNVKTSEFDLWYHVAAITITTTKHREYTEAPFGLTERASALCSLGLVNLSGVCNLTFAPYFLIRPALTGYKGHIEVNETVSHTQRRLGS